jgi:hypothetical protein
MIMSAIKGVYSTLYEDELHNLRLELAERWSHMTKKDAKKEQFEMSERTRLAIEKIKQQRNKENKVRG